MTVLFEDLRLHVRRHGLHTSRHAYGELPPCLMEEATIKDEERAIAGSMKQLEEDRCENIPHDQRQWVEDAEGNHFWMEANQLKALMEGWGHNDKGTVGGIASEEEGTERTQAREHFKGIAIVAGRRTPTQTNAKKRQHIPKNEDGEAKHPKLRTRCAKPMLANTKK